jgi:ATP-binding cassette subfamily C protein
MTSEAFPHAFRRLVSLAPPRKTISLLALMVLAALSEGIGIMLLVPMLQALGPTGEAYGLPLSALLGVFVALVLFRTALLNIQARKSQELIHMIVDGLRSTCFAALLRAEWRWLSQTRASDHASLIITNVARVGIGLQQGLALIAGSVSVLACLVAALALSWPLALTAIGGAAILMLLFSSRQGRSAEIGMAMGVANRALQSSIQESLAGLRLTRMWQAEEPAREAPAEAHSVTRPAYRQPRPSGAIQALSTLVRQPPFVR